MVDFYNRLSKADFGDRFWWSMLMIDYNHRLQWSISMLIPKYPWISWTSVIITEYSCLSNIQDYQGMPMIINECPSCGRVRVQVAFECFSGCGRVSSNLRLSVVHGTVERRPFTVECARSARRPAGRPARRPAGPPNINEYRRSISMICLVNSVTVIDVHGRFRWSISRIDFDAYVGNR